MSDVSIRRTGRAGRITLTRPKALNALTYEMCLSIETAFDQWCSCPDVDVIVLDAEGERAFCAGGDIAKLYSTGRQGDFDFGRRFWADEYRLNARIFNYPKPVISFLQGFVMGGGVGIGCHGTHRVVGETSQVSMPECGIGLIPDVGGTFMLALAPGRLGEYLGTTGIRMSAADALLAGFADMFIPQALWPDLIGTLEATGDPSCLLAASQTPEPGPLSTQRDLIDAHFGGEGLIDIQNSLQSDDSEFAKSALAQLARVSPLSAACTIEVIHRLRGPSLTIEKALDLEYRFTWRAMQQGDFLEGIRAAIIDKDRAPEWKFSRQSVPAIALSKMLMPLGKDALSFVPSNTVADTP